MNTLLAYLKSYGPCRPGDLPREMRRLLKTAMADGHVRMFQTGGWTRAPKHWTLRGPGVTRGPGDGSTYPRETWYRLTEGGAQ